MTARPLIIAVLLSAAALSACGKTGELEQPAPLFGEHAKADYAAKKRADAAARAREAAAKKAQPRAPVVGDPTAGPMPNAPYSPSIPGSGPNPFSGSPQGVLPNPGTAPDQ
jgi:hypothetical protein